jgi:hypothetical protein
MTEPKIRILENSVRAVLAAGFLLQLAFVDGLSVPWGGRSLALNYPWTGLFIWSVWEAGVHFRRRRHNGKSFFTGYGIFWVAMAGFLSTFRWHGCDNLPTSLLPFSILREGNFHLDEFLQWFGGERGWDLVYSGEHWASFYPALPALLALPVYVLPVSRGVLPELGVLHQLEKCTAVWVSALTVFLFFKMFLRRLEPRSAFFLALLYAFGTATFGLSSHSLWQHGASCLFLAAGLYFMDGGNWARAGFCFAVAVAGRTTNALFIPFLLGAAGVSGGARAIRQFLAGSVIPAGLAVSYCGLVLGTGVPADMSRVGFGFHLVPQWSALSAMMVSPYRGWMLYSPITLFGFWGIVECLRSPSGEKRWMAGFLGSAVVASYLLYAQYKTWSGGWAVGPRFLLEASTLLFYFLPEAWVSVRRMMWSRALWSVAVTVSFLVNGITAFARWRWEMVAGGTFPASVWKWRSWPPVFVLSPR